MKREPTRKGDVDFSCVIFLRQFTRLVLLLNLHTGTDASELSPTYVGFAVLASSRNCDTPSKER